MPATPISRGGASYPAIQTGAHADQLAIGAAPSAAKGVNFDAQTGLSTLYVQGSDHNTSALEIYKHFTEAQRAYDGSDTIRAAQAVALFMSDCDYNDPTQSPVGLINRGTMSYQRFGFNNPHYGSGLGMVTYQVVVNSGSANNEFALNHGYLQVGTNAAPTVAAVWGVGDWGVYGPVGLRPNVYTGASVVERNFYNGSPVLGASVGWAIQNILPSGPGGNVTGSNNTYPIDVGYHAGGWATQGTHDSYAVAFQAGGRVSPWGADTWDNGTLDLGQVGVGFQVPAKLDGTTPCSRLGAFVSQGLSEAGGWIGGIDTTDANRVSIFRSANGVMSIRGQIIPVSLASAANDGAAATAGVPVGGIYQTSGAVKVRLS